MSEGLAQGPYVAARGGVKPRDLRHRRHRTPPLSRHAPSPSDIQWQSF